MDKICSKFAQQPLFIHPFRQICSSSTPLTMFGLSNNERNVRHGSVRSKSTWSDSKAPLKVLVSGAAGQIGSYILQLIASGRLSGDRKVEINMLDIDGVEKIMHGVRMEIEDCCYPSLHKVNVFTKSDEALADVDCAILLANKMVLTADIKRVDLLAANKDLYTEMGENFEKYAKPDALAVVVANPCNTNCLVMKKSAPKRDPKSFSSLSRLDHNRLRAFIAEKLQVSNGGVRKCTIWGNHSHSMHPDVRFTEYDTAPKSHRAKYEKITDAITDAKWLKETLPWEVKDRAYAVIKSRGKSSSLSAGNAAVDHMRDWVGGTPDGDWVSMGVYSDGTKYGIPEDIFYAMPVVCHSGQYSVVEDLPIDKDTHEKMMLSAEELLEEKKLAGIN